MTIDSGDPPPPIDLSVGVMFTPDPTAAFQSFDFFNDLNGIVTSFTLTTTVAKGFTGPFTCSSGYFLTCSHSYDSTTGVLSYSFSGVNPADGDETCPLSNPTCESGEKEGIPINGLFHFGLDGWDDQTGLYTMSSPPVPIVGTFTLTPEPSTVFSAGLGVLLLGGIAAFRRRRSTANR